MPVQSLNQLIAANNVIKEETGYKKNTALRVGQHTENIILTMFSLLSSPGGSGVGIFPPILTEPNDFPVTGLTGKDYWLINNFNKLFSYVPSSTAIIDNITVFEAAGGGRWILSATIGGGGAKTIELRWAKNVDPANRVYNLSAAVVLNGVTGTLPDISPEGIISVDTGAHQYQSTDFIVAARTITFLPGEAITAPFIYMRYQVPGTGGGDDPGGDPSAPAFTIEAKDRIFFTEEPEQIPGVPNIGINSNPEVVTNQVNAVTPAPVGTIPVSTNTSGSDQQSSGVSFIADRLQGVPASNAADGVAFQFAYNPTSGELYMYILGAWVKWTVVKTFTNP